ncbi:MAG TPA: hypothetical protein VKZ18_12440 [Polyangia bacterium]|nr:hypothetical protein [Polyangia bacterium]
MSGNPPTPNPPGGLVGDAQATLDECKHRWDKFREKSALTLDNYIDESVHYVQDVLDDSSGPREWVKGGVALWIEGYGATRRIWTSAYRLLFPGDRED